MQLVRYSRDERFVARGSKLRMYSVDVTLCISGIALYICGDVLPNDVQFTVPVRVVFNVLCQWGFEVAGDKSVLGVAETSYWYVNRHTSSDANKHVD